MRRLAQAHRWRWNRQQRRAVDAIAGALLGPSGIWHVPHVMHMRTLERGYALAARIRRDEATAERRRPRITMAFTKAWEYAVHSMMGAWAL